MLILLILMALVNLVAVFGPEIGFDALWYHLTLPKLWLSQQRWFFPGGLLYYSAMPRLAETLFIPLLAAFGTAGPKFLQFAAGLFSTLFTYKIARRFLDKNSSILAALLFYNTWLVSWQSGTAYVDLIRTFFETLALYFLVLRRRPLWAGVFFGLAIGVKWQALASLIAAALVFTPAILFPALLVASPWMVIAWRFTGHPLYPLFESFMAQTQLSQVATNFYSPLAVLQRIFFLPYLIGTPYDTALNPLVGGLFVLGAILALRSPARRLLVYVLIGLVLWQLTPPPSGRYLLPYLPLIAIIAAFSLKTTSQPAIKATIILFAAGMIVTRSAANSKFLPVILGQQTQNQFLYSQAARLPGAFVDVDDWIGQNLPADTKVLVDRLHNLYYLPVNFDHTSWADPQTHYPYLITQNTDPKTITGQLLHTNSLGTQIFKLE